MPRASPSACIAEQAETPIRAALCCVGSAGILKLGEKKLWPFKVSHDVIRAVNGEEYGLMITSCKLPLQFDPQRLRTDFDRLATGFILIRAYTPRAPRDGRGHR
jgi:hypothetical protein